MFRKNIIYIIALFLFVFNSNNTFGQCTTVNCNLTSATGLFSTALGNGTVTVGEASFATGFETYTEGFASFATGSGCRAEGDNSSAFGVQSISSGFNSFAVGMMSEASTGGSVVIGHFLRTTANDAFILGRGESPDEYLVNNIPYSLMIGFKSINPTFFVGQSTTSSNHELTGRVGIGNMNALPNGPQAKLHLRADDGEAATIFIEPNNWGVGEIAKLILGNTEHYITTNNTLGMEFLSQNDFVFSGINVGIGISNPDYKLDVAGDINFTGSLFTNGDLFRESQWEQSGDNITFMTGKVGIGTTNFVEDYGLYVNNGILTSEVMIKDPSVWFDYVFEDDYNLMTITDLEKFINNNKHLPEVPSETEVTENGYGLAEMNGILLKKIEELTLYIIQQQKQLTDMASRVDELEISNKK